MLAGLLSDDEDSGDARTAAKQVALHNAYTAAAALLFVAYTTSSVTGLLFLFFFCVWGALCIATPSLQRSYYMHLALWITVAIFSGLLFAGQLLVQLLYGLHLLHVDSSVLEVLGMLGFEQKEGLHVVLVVSAPLLSLLTSATEAQEARVNLQLLRIWFHTDPDGAIQAAATLQNPSNPISMIVGGLPVPMLLGLEYTNVGIFLSALLVAIAVIMPCLLNLMYLLVVAVGMMRWGCWKTVSAGQISVRLLQMYVGLHLALQYVWQVPYVQNLVDTQLPALVLQVVNYMGVYKFADSDKWVVHMVHLVLLHLLYLMLGLHHATIAHPLCVSHTAAPPAPEIVSSPTSSIARGSWPTPTLLEGYVPLDPGPSPSPSPRRSVNAAPPLQVGDGNTPPDEFLRHISTSNSTLYRLMTLGKRLSNSEEYPAGMGLLSEDVVETSTREDGGEEGFPPKHDLFASRTPGPFVQELTSGGPNNTAEARGNESRLTTWEETGLVLQILLPLAGSLLMYTVEAIVSGAGVSAIALCCISTLDLSMVCMVLLVVGLWSLLLPRRFGKGVLKSCSTVLAALLLLWHLACYIVTCLGPVLSLDPLIHSIFDFGARSEIHQPVAVMLLSQLGVACCLCGLSRSKYSKGSTAPQSRWLSTLLTPLVGPVTSIAPMHRVDHAGVPEMGVIREGEEGVFWEEVSMAGIWMQLAIFFVRIITYAGYIIVPASWLALVFVKQDTLHSVYLAWLLLYYLYTDFRLAPPLAKPLNGTPHSRHVTIRIYSSLHVLVMYVAKCSKLPGLRPDVVEKVNTFMKYVGVDNPTMAGDVWPVLVAFLLATVHSNMGKWLERACRSRPPHSSGTVLPARPASIAHAATISPADYIHSKILKFFGNMAASFGVQVVLLVGYLLVLLDTRLSLLGLAYLVLLWLSFLFQPVCGHYTALLLMRQEQRSGCCSEFVWAWRWSFLALLALCCAADAACQFVLAAVPIQNVLHLSDGLLQWLRDVAGLEPGAHGTKLEMGLARPIIMLAVLQIYRWCYCHGMQHIWRQHQYQHRGLDYSSDNTESLAAQCTWAGLFKRFIIICSLPLLAITCFAASVQEPGVAGLLLVLVLVGCGPFVFGSFHVNSYTLESVQMLLLRLAQLLGGGWLLAQYAYKISWIRDQVSFSNPHLQKLPVWLGLRADGDLEYLLRWKCLILLVATLYNRAARWERNLPYLLRKYARYGNSFCLFWPPPGHELQFDSYVRRGQGLVGQTLLQPLRLAISRATEQVILSMKTLLEAIDVPLAASRQHVVVSMQSLSANRSLRSPSNTSGTLPQRAGSSPQLSRTMQDGPTRAEDDQFWELLIMGVQKIVIGLMHKWGMEMCMLALLVTALLSCNLLSLIYLIMVGLGMWLPAKARQRVWRSLVLPALGMLLVYQYSCFMKASVADVLRPPAPPPPVPSPPFPPPPHPPSPPSPYPPSPPPSPPSSPPSPPFSSPPPSPPVSPSSPPPSPYSPSPPLSPPVPASASPAPQWLSSLPVHTFDPTLPTRSLQNTTSSSQTHVISTYQATISSSADTLSRMARHPSEQPSLSEVPPPFGQALSERDVQGTDGGSGGWGKTRNGVEVSSVGAGDDGDDDDEGGDDDDDGGYDGGGDDGDDVGGGHEESRERMMKAWFGLRDIKAATIWALFTAFGLCCVQVGNTTRKQRTESGLLNADGYIPLHAAYGDDSDIEDHPTRSGLNQLFRPLEPSEQWCWTWADWTRYVCLKHSVDLVLVCVVLLCMLRVVKDLVHVGYLILALLFFHARSLLHNPKSHLFMWLPAYNYLIIAITLLYQAPIKAMLGNKHWSDRGKCAIPRLIGLSKLTMQDHSSEALSITGAVADVILWVLLRLQCRLLASNTYKKAMAVVAHEREMAAQQQEERQISWRLHHAFQALQASRMAAMRRKRIQDLKQALKEDGPRSKLRLTLQDAAHLTAGTAERERQGAGDESAQASNLYNSQQSTDLPTTPAPPNILQPDGTTSTSAAWYKYITSLVMPKGTDSPICYVFFIVGFAWNFSILMLMFPLSMFLYALLTKRQATRYWPAVLFYTEMLLVLQYMYGILPDSCGREAHPWVNDLVKYRTDQVLNWQLWGLQPHAFDCIPLFLIYLSTLMHNYHLQIQQPARSQGRGRRRGRHASTGSITMTAPAAQRSHPPSAGEIIRAFITTTHPMSPAGPDPATRRYMRLLSPEAVAPTGPPQPTIQHSFSGGRNSMAVSVPMRRPGIGRSVSHTIRLLLQSWVYAVWAYSLDLAWDFIQLCRHQVMVHEQTPHWIKVDVARTSYMVQMDLQDASDLLQLETTVQHVLDGLRRASPLDMDQWGRRVQGNGQGSSGDITQSTRVLDLSTSTRLVIHLEQVVDDPSQPHVSLLFEVVPDPACPPEGHTLLSPQRVLPSLFPSRDAAQALKYWQMWQQAMHAAEDTLELALTSHSIPRLAPIPPNGFKPQYSASQGRGEGVGDGASAAADPNRMTTLTRNMLTQAIGADAPSTARNLYVTDLSTIPATSSRPGPSTAPSSSHPPSKVILDPPLSLPQHNPPHTSPQLRRGANAATSSQRANKQRPHPDHPLQDLLSTSSSDDTGIVEYGSLSPEGSINIFPPLPLCTSPPLRGLGVMQNASTSSTMPHPDLEDMPGSSMAGPSRDPDGTHGGVHRLSQVRREPIETRSHEVADVGPDTTPLLSARAALSGASMERIPPISVRHTPERQRGLSPQDGVVLRGVGVMTHRPEGGLATLAEEKTEGEEDVAGVSKLGGGLHGAPSFALMSSPMSPKGVDIFPESPQPKHAGVPPEYLMRVQAVESHSLNSKDYYAITAFFDFVSFVYAALTYQMVYNSKTLGDITEEKVPLSYLLALMLLFALMVADRAAYACGAPGAKAIHHLFQTGLFLAWMMKEYWKLNGKLSASEKLSADDKSTGQQTHVQNILSGFVLLRCVSLAFGAMQLRSGYPPPASTTPGGPGRQTFYFYRRHDLLHLCGFYIFFAVPFLYELRNMLDWTCTSTTMTWYEWLKLEDIRSSLYICECGLRMSKSRKRGERVPRYVKLLQGVVLFTLLLLILWVPLLMFSSFNPNYGNPHLVDARVNISLVATSGDAAGSWKQVMQFPIFDGGNRRGLSFWGGNGTLPPGLAGLYQNEQVRLVCVAQDSDVLWHITPVARAALEEAIHAPNTSYELSIQMQWTLVRDQPQVSPRSGGGPVCSDQAKACSGCRGCNSRKGDDIPLSAQTRAQLGEMLAGKRTSVVLERMLGEEEANCTSKATKTGLYSMFWRLSNEQCLVHQGPPSTVDLSLAVQGSTSWSNQMVGCNVSVVAVSDLSQWWRFQCGGVYPQQPRYPSPPPPPPASPPPPGGSSPPSPPDNSSSEFQPVTCPSGLEGPQLVALLEKVQIGVIGTILSSFGITGLYITFVYGIGRFLRLSVTNLRLKIPYEDLPVTTELWNLTQDIVIARAEGELVLEEELFRSLINIYRSPTHLYDMTKEKVE